MMIKVNHSKSDFKVLNLFMHHQLINLLLTIRNHLQQISFMFDLNNKFFLIFRWVLLKNVHLATTWLVSLEKKLHSLQPHPNFRLFMTMEVNPKVPVNLLRASRIFVYEPPPGIKANLLRTFSTISVSRMSQAPAERSRMYFLLAWFHAIVQERVRYAPLGWSKSYEFNESDLRVGFDMLDIWIASVSQNRANIPPEKLPWDAFSTCLLYTSPSPRDKRQSRMPSSA